MLCFGLVEVTDGSVRHNRFSSGMAASVAEFTGKMVASVIEERPGGRIGNVVAYQISDDLIRTAAAELDAARIARTLPASGW